MYRMIDKSDATQVQKLNTVANDLSRPSGLHARSTEKGKASRGKKVLRREKVKPRMSDGPKLYINKPKKGQLKQKAKDFSSPAPSAMGSTPPPPPPPPKESFARRYKFFWPMILTVNLAIGVYFFMKTNKKHVVGETDQSVGETTAPVASMPAIASEKTLPVPLTPIPEPIKISQLIPENEQRELFKWMLEEKRKVKPSDPLEKKQIDEEKAILKQFLRAKSIPSF